MSTPGESDRMVCLQQVVRVDVRLDLAEPPMHVRREEALRLGRPLHEVQEREPGVPRREGGLDEFDMALDGRLRLRRWRDPRAEVQEPSLERRERSVLGRRNREHAADVA